MQTKLTELLGSELPISGGAMMMAEAQGLRDALRF